MWMSWSRKFAQALYIQARLLLAFLALTFLFPKQGRPDEYVTEGHSAEASSIAAPAGTGEPR